MDNKIEAPKDMSEFLHLLDEYEEWFHKFIRVLIYPDLGDVAKGLKKPEAFRAWVHSSQREALDIQDDVLEKLTALHSDLMEVSDKLISHAMQGITRPEFELFDTFMTLYEEFVGHVQRLERDLFLEDNGVDLVTGLRSMRVMEDDLGREFDRFARQGRNFCVALIRIDHFKKINESSSTEGVEVYLRQVADLIKLSIRSFDDAYYVGVGEFVLCLKQADISGGISALERLRREMEKRTLDVRIGESERVSLSISCCISEPVLGDSPVDLVRHLQEDLDIKCQSRVDSVLRYHELSPLQRYVQEKKV